MANTPEGKVKKRIREYLATTGCFAASKAGAFPERANGWYYMPVGGPGGVSGIPDFIGQYKGTFFSIEAKAPGKKPTGFQKLQIEAIRISGGACFVVDGDLSEVQAFLELL